MDKVETDINGVFILERKIFKDERGSFSEFFNKKELRRLNIKFNLCQINSSKNRHAGIFRGFHYQVYPFAQAKIVICVRGRVVDCVLDINKRSKTYGKSFLCQLSETGNQALYIPAGLAHGYMALEKGSEVVYLTSNYYNKESERGIRHNDPFFAINLPFTGQVLVNNRDRSWPLWK